MSSHKPSQELIDLARTARERAYSPYSRCKVGAALRTRDGRVFEGCNVENSSYGAAICAERSAIAHAISRVGGIEITEIAVVTDASPPWPPCGICRQSLVEFGPDATIHLANLKGEVRSYGIRELLPEAFTPAHLKK